MFNDIRLRSSYSQQTWVVRYLQNYLTRSIVIMTQPLIGTARIAIDFLLLRAAIMCQSVLSAPSTLNSLLVCYHKTTFHFNAELQFTT